jgi:hypothetical protein
MEVKEKLMNPSPLGLLGFGMTTVLLNLHNASLIPLSIVIIGMGIALGGLAQIIAGILEFKNNNNFAGLAFVAYGTFWWSLVIIWLFGKDNLVVDKVSMGYYLSLWSLFTLFMFIGTLKHNKITQFVFGTLTALFFLLAIGDFTNNHVITTYAGIVGIICGLSAIYNAVGQVLHEEYGKKFLPFF